MACSTVPDVGHCAKLLAHPRPFGLIPVGFAIAFVEGSHVFTTQFGP